jgi:hypothetical protein
VADRLARCIDDPCCPDQVIHSLADMIGFRMKMIAAGYEDGNETPTGCVPTRSSRWPRMRCLRVGIWRRNRRCADWRTCPMWARCSPWAGRWSISTAGAARPRTTSSPGRRILPPTERPAPRRQPTSSGSSCTPAPTGSCGGLRAAMPKRSSFAVAQFDTLRFAPHQDRRAGGRDQDANPPAPADILPRPAHPAHRP